MNRPLAPALLALALAASACGDDTASGATSTGTAGAQPEGGGGSGGGAGGASGGGGAAALPVVTSISESELSTSEHEPQIVVGSEGRIVAAWNAFNADPTNFYHLEVAISDDLGQSWGDVVSFPLPDDNNIGSNTSLAAAPDGTIYFVYATEYVDQQGTRSNQRVWLATLGASDDAFSAPVQVTDPAETVGVYDQPAISVTPSGDLLITYGEAPPDLATLTLVTQISQDGGETWTREVPFPTGAPEFMNLFHHCVAPDSERLYLLYADSDLAVGLWRSEDGGHTFLSENRVQVPSPEEKSTASRMVDGNCVAVGDEVWAIYGLSTNPFGFGGAIPRLDNIVVAHSSDGGATFDRRAHVEDTTLGPHYLLPRIALEPSGAIDITYYEGEAQGDDAASYRHARSTDGGQTFGPSELVYEPVLYEIRRTNEQWLGDYMGLAAVNGSLVGVFTDNSAAQAHISFFSQALPED